MKYVWLTIKFNYFVLPASVGVSYVAIQFRLSNRDDQMSKGVKISQRCEWLIVTSRNVSSKINVRPSKVQIPISFLITWIFWSNNSSYNDLSKNHRIWKWPNLPRRHIFPWRGSNVICWSHIWKHKHTQIIGVARTLKKMHTSKTTGSCSDYLQLRSFSKWELLLRKEFAPRGSEFFPSWAIPYSMGNHLYHIKAAYSVTFDLLILELMFLFFKNTVKKLKFRYTFYQYRKS